MIVHPSEYWEACHPDADTTSRADYTGMVADEPEEVQG